MSSRIRGVVESGLFIPAEKLGRLRTQARGSLRLTHLVNDLLITPHLQPGERPKPLLYGDLRLLGVAELVALLSSMRKDGVLTFLVPSARNTFCFSKGEIIYASTTVEDYRLSEVIWRRGLISLEQLCEMYPEVTPHKKAGIVLVEKGWVSPHQVLDGLKQQVKEIIDSSLYFDKGEFVFVEGKVSPQFRIQLDKPTRDILLEEVRHIQQKQGVTPPFSVNTKHLQLLN